jgi:hypothetical protein
MKTAAGLVPFLLCAALAVAVGPQAARARAYTDPHYGFSIDPPKVPIAGAGASATPAMFFAPAEEGFAANMGVVVQTQAMTAAQYGEITRGQLKDAGFKVYAEKALKVAGRDALLWDYEGAVQGRDLHWLALAVMDTERVYLVTCTATSAGFGKHQKAFQAALDSFTLPPLAK